jgi:undecaprenyl-diphosphatase
MQELIILCAKYLIGLPIVVYVIFWWLLPSALRWRAFLLLCISGVASYVVAFVAGLVYYDPRPFVMGNFTPLIAHAPDNGFPSDHALLASVLAFSVFYFNKPLGVFLFVVALLIGAARVLAGVHHVLDIAGSVLIAGVIVTLIYYMLPVRTHEA